MNHAFTSNDNRTRVFLASSSGNEATITIVRDGAGHLAEDGSIALGRAIEALQVFYLQEIGSDVLGAGGIY